MAHPLHARRSDRAAPCLVIVAAAGYGKTRELRESAAGLDAALVDAGALLDGRWTPGTEDETRRHLLVDAFHCLPVDEQRRVARSMAALPRDLSIAIASREPVDDAVTSLLDRSLVVYGPADLALDFVGVTAVLRDDYDLDDPDLASHVLRVTAGWPELVHQVARALAGASTEPGDRVGCLSRLGRPGTWTAGWVSDEVLAPLPPRLRTLVLTLGALEPVSVSLLDALADEGVLPGADFAADLDRLSQTGVVVPWFPVGEPKEPMVRVVPLVAAAIAPHDACSSLDHDLAACAARWYTANGLPLAAANLLAASGDQLASLQLVADHGDELLAHGGAAAVAAVTVGVSATDPGMVTLTAAERGRVRMVAADAARMLGDVVTAKRAFDCLDADPSTGPLPGLAWRMASAHYLAADYERALDVSRAGLGRVAADDHPADVVRLHACASTADLMLGHDADSRRHAESALAMARQTDDDQALAIAHLVNALSRNGARRDNHLAEALSAARRCGDVVTAARVLVNQADALLCLADYRRALTVGLEALEAADQVSTGIVVYALHNVGEALLWLGRYDESRAYFARSIQICRRLGLSRTATGLWGLAEIDRHAGRTDQAQAALIEVIDLARDSGEVQVLVPALAGLARTLLLADGPTDLTTPAELADEAVALAGDEQRSQALLARGWVALAAGDVAAAGDLATQALASGRLLRSARHCADALELVAASHPDPDRARTAQVDATHLWRTSGAEVAWRRALVRLGDLPGSSGSHRSEARDARRWLTANGLPSPSLPEQGRAAQATATVRLRVLGGFDAVVDETPVALPAWKSRQARSLVKILASRRGRVVTRANLCELLWPDDDPQRTPHRLSVLLSAVRGVLDPQRTHPPDHYVQADLVGVRLDLSHVEVDAEEFLTTAAEAAELSRCGDSASARALAERAESLYLGDAFEDDPYDEWADGLREECRTAWLRCLRLTAALGVADDPDRAVSCLVKLLGADPFDEASYRLLVETLRNAGRHGEARRVFARWVEAMRTIDAPMPQLATFRSGLAS